MDSSDLNDRIHEVARDVSQVDERSGARLNELADLLEQPDYGNQAALDLYSAIEPRGIEESAFLKYQHRSFPLSMVEWIRNVIVLAPICLTWYALWQGTRAYRTLIVSREDLITRPFLLLWEEGFKELGTYTGLRFSQVAWWDFVLLLIVVILTVIVHFNRDIQETRATKSALLLRQRVEDILWEAGKLLSEERYCHEAASVAQFDRSATVLIEQLQNERVQLDALIAKRGGEVTDLTKLGNSLKAGAQNLQGLSKNLQQGYEPLRLSLNDLGARADVIKVQQADLQETMANLGQHAAALTALALRVGQSLHASTDEMGQAADRIAISAGQSTATFQEICSLLDEALHRNEAISANLRQATETAGNFSQEIVGIGAALRDVEKHVGPVLHDFANRAESLTNRLETSIGTLERSGLSLQTASNGIMASSDRIVKYAEVATNGFQDAGRQMNDLGQQLETITQGLQGALNKASGFSQIMNDSATQLRAASQNMQPTLDAFARQTALAADQLSQTANKLNRASAPQHAGWRPEQWLVIGLGLTMMGGILIALVMQTLHLF